jgi:hypothetical protein
VALDALIEVSKRRSVERVGHGLQVRIGVAHGNSRPGRKLHTSRPTQPADCPTAAVEQPRDIAAPTEMAANVDDAGGVCGDREELVIARTAFPRLSFHALQPHL